MDSSPNPPESTSAHTISMVEDHTMNASNAVLEVVASSAINAGTRPSTLAMIGKKQTPSAVKITVTVEEKTESSPQLVLNGEQKIEVKILEGEK